MRCPRSTPRPTRGPRGDRPAPARAWPSPLAARSRRSASRLSARRDATRRPLGDAVLQGPRQRREGHPGGPAGGARRSSAPCCQATTGSASWPGPTSRPRRCRSDAGSRPAWARQASMERDGKADFELAPGQPLFVDRERAAGRPEAAPRLNRGRPRCRVHSRGCLHSIGLFRKRGEFRCPQSATDPLTRSNERSSWPAVHCTCGFSVRIVCWYTRLSGA